MAYLEESNVFIKSYAYHFEFHKYINEIIDPETGQIHTVIKRTRNPFNTKPDAIDSGMLRTGATAALGSRAISFVNIQGMIGDVVTGKITGREVESDITVFDSNGTHIQSGVVVNLIFEKAKKLGLGKEENGVSDFFINP
jgi:hypothetical protein